MILRNMSATSAATTRRRPCPSSHSNSSSHSHHCTNTSHNNNKWSTVLWLLALSTAAVTQAFDVPLTPHPRQRARVARQYAPEAVVATPSTNTVGVHLTPQQEQHLEALQQRLQQQPSTVSAKPLQVLQDLLASSSSQTTTAASAATTTAPKKRRRKRKQPAPSTSTSSTTSGTSSGQDQKNPLDEKDRRELLAKLISYHERKLQKQRRGTITPSSKSSVKIRRASHQHARVAVKPPLREAPTTNFPTFQTIPTSAAMKTQRVARQKSHNHKNNSLLTKSEEVDYAQQLKTMRQAIRTRDELVKEQDGLYIHPTEEQWAQACDLPTVEALRELMLQGQQARSTLCTANVGLVTSIAKRHYKSLKLATEAGSGSVGTILTLHDMIQEGNLGLMEAAERFEPSRGFRFSTYATWWIRQRILRAISDSSRVIRLPAHVHGMLHKIRRARVEIQSASGQKATLEQLSQKLGVPVEKLQRYTDSSRNVVSLEVPLGSAKQPQEANVHTLGDTLASDAPTPDDNAQAEYLKRDIAHVMDTELTDVEQDVIRHRFGFVASAATGRSSKAGGTCFTVAQTAQALELTVDRVRLIEARALNKLRSPQKNYRLREYVGASPDSHDNHGAYFQPATKRNRKRNPKQTSSSKAPQDSDDGSERMDHDDNDNDSWSRSDHDLFAASPSFGHPQRRRSAEDGGSDSSFGDHRNKNHQKKNPQAHPQDTNDRTDRMWFF